MTVINANVDDKLVKQFRHVIYNKHVLKKGDFKNALEEAMLDYIRKYGEKGSGVDRLAETAKTINNRDDQDEIESMYAELERLETNVDEIRALNPTKEQLSDLLAGLKKIRK